MQLLEVRELRLSRFHTIDVLNSLCPWLRFLLLLFFIASHNISIVAHNICIASGGGKFLICICQDLLVYLITIVFERQLLFSTILLSRAMRQSTRRPRGQQLIYAASDGYISIFCFLRVFILFDFKM